MVEHSLLSVEWLRGHPGPDPAGADPESGPEADQLERLRAHIAEAGTVPSDKEVRRLLGRIGPCGPGCSPRSGRSRPAGTATGRGDPE